jgi:hypothetical protein
MCAFCDGTTDLNGLLDAAVEEQFAQPRTR